MGSAKPGGAIERQYLLNGELAGEADRSMSAIDVQ